MADARIGDRLRRGTLLATLLVYALIQIGYVAATPLQRIALPDNLPQVPGAPRSLLVGIGPDEKEHFLYVLSLAHRGEPPAPDPARRAAPDQYVSYQAQHPPLFYALAALVYRVTAGLGPAAVWYVLRALCVLCGAITIVFAARAARAAFPDDPLLVLGTAPFVAFLPMFGHMTGNLSNEPLAMALGAWAWLQIARSARSESPPTLRDGALLGAALGLAALTRLTALLWLPAAFVVLAYRWRAPGAAGRPAVLAAFVVCFSALLAPWLARNQIVFGAAVVRTFYRPLLEGITLREYLADPQQPVQPRGFPQPIVVTPLDTALWYAATAWLPFWLVQFYLPGGPRAAGAWQAVFLLVDAFALVSLFLHASRARRGEIPADPAGRALLWAAAGAVGVCALVVLQQQLYVDWNVLFSAGRYLVAAAPAGAVLFLFAVSVRARSPRGRRIAAMGVAAGMLALDLVAVSLVRRFYAEHPRQPDVQRITRATQPLTAFRQLAILLPDKRGGDGS